MVTANRVLDETLFKPIFKGVRERMFKFIDKYIQPKFEFLEGEEALEGTQNIRTLLNEPVNIETPAVQDRKDPVLLVKQSISGDSK